MVDGFVSCDRPSAGVVPACVVDKWDSWLCSAASRFPPGGWDSLCVGLGEAWNMNARKKSEKATVESLPVVGYVILGRSGVDHVRFPLYFI